MRRYYKQQQKCKFLIFRWSSSVLSLSETASVMSSCHKVKKVADTTVGFVWSDFAMRNGLSWTKSHIAKGELCIILPILSCYSCVNVCVCEGVCVIETERGRETVRKYETGNKQERMCFSVCVWVCVTGCVGVCGCGCVCVCGCGCGCVCVLG